MQRVTAEATRSDGRAVPLNNLKSMRLAASMDTPAVSLTAVFAAESPAAREEYTSVKVLGGGGALFEGAVDVQRTTASGSGVTTQIDARSRAALLLDNEAMPSQLLFVRLMTVYSRHIAPYGFSLAQAPRYQSNNGLPIYTVDAGLSEWDAFANFVRLVYGVTPYVAGNAVVIGRRDPGAAVFRISNSGEGAKFTSLTAEQSPYDMVSAIYLRDENGQYPAMVRNPAAISRGITRRRYVTPANEYMQNHSIDANLRIRRSMLAASSVVAELPGIHNAEPGDAAAVTDPAFAAHNLLVTKKEIILGPGGVFTRLTLRSSLYYD